jgi:transposase-like protein
MRLYPEEQKTRLIERMLPPQAVPVPQLSRETGIPADTLYDWRRQARRARGLSATPTGRGQRWSTAEKFAMVVETAALNEAERGAYCRQRGLDPEQLQTWHRACEQANATPAAARSKTATLTDKRRVQALERELRRKDKALAEAAALLVLRKKADAIWGTDEDA